MEELAGFIIYVLFFRIISFIEENIVFLYLLQTNNLE